MDKDERGFWILLYSVPGIGPIRFQNLLQLCGDARSAWHASDQQFVRAGLERRNIETIKRRRQSVTSEQALANLARLGITALTLEDANYPSTLRHVVDAPPVLFTRGAFTAQDEPAVALIGTRRATGYGRIVAQQFAAQLANAGVTVVSGLARGIDTFAHRSALDAGGRTIAVLGNGLDQIYPPENRNLAHRIVDESCGA